MQILLQNLLGRGYSVDRCGFVGASPLPVPPSHPQTAVEGWKTLQSRFFCMTARDLGVRGKGCPASLVEIF